MIEKDFKIFSSTNHLVWNKITSVLQEKYPSFHVGKPGEVFLGNLGCNEKKDIFESISLANKRKFKIKKGNYNSLGERYVLPMIDKNFVTQWQSIAYISAILQGNLLTELYMNYFVDLRMHWKKNLTNVDMYHSTQYIVSVIDAYTLANTFFVYKNYPMLDGAYELVIENIVEYVKARLKENKYVSLMLDQYYLFDSKHYKSVHSNLRRLIYGFDDEKKVFFSIGFNRNDLFGISLVTYDECEEAYEVNKITATKGDNYFTEYALSSESYGYKFNLSLFVKKIKAYYYSEQTEFDSFFENMNTASKHAAEMYAGVDHYSNDMEHADGLAVYSFYIRFLNEYKPGDTILYQNFHALYEHKRLLYERFVFIDKNVKRLPVNSLKDYETVIKITNNIRLIILLSIKRGMTDMSKLIYRVTTSLRECEQLEKRALLPIINCLE